VGDLDCKIKGKTREGSWPGMERVRGKMDQLCMAKFHRRIVRVSPWPSQCWCRVLESRFPLGSMLKMSSADLGLSATEKASGEHAFLPWECFGKDINESWSSSGMYAVKKRLWPRVI
jgi:hypothetical protein